jgi:predicted nuclease of predicted toxin-antitoxin system
VKIKLDENLPDRLVSVLAGLAHDVDTVRGEHLTGRADPDVWSAAQAAQRFLITQDLDFSDVRRYTPGTHTGLLVVRLTTRSQRVIRARIDSVPDGEDRRVDWMPRGRHRTEDSHQTTGATNGTLIKAEAEDGSIGCSSRTTSAYDLEGLGRDHRGSARA